MAYRSCQVTCKMRSLLSRLTVCRSRLGSAFGSSGHCHQASTAWTWTWKGALQTCWIVSLTVGGSEEVHMALPELAAFRITYLLQFACLLLQQRQPSI